MHSKMINKCTNCGYYLSLGFNENKLYIKKKDFGEHRIQSTISFGMKPFKTVFACKGHFEVAMSRIFHFLKVSNQSCQTKGGMLALPF